MGELRIFAQKLALSHPPSARKSRISDTQIRVPLMQGLPPQVRGSTEMRRSKGVHCVLPFRDKKRSPFLRRGPAKAEANKRRFVLQLRVGHISGPVRYPHLRNSLRWSGLHRPNPSASDWTRIRNGASAACAGERRFPLRSPASVRLCRRLKARSGDLRRSMNCQSIRMSFRLWTYASSTACGRKVMSSMTHFRKCSEIVHSAVAKGVFVSSGCRPARHIRGEPVYASSAERTRPGAV